MKTASFFEKCGSCSLFATFVSLATILVTISLFLFGYSIYNKGDIDNVRFEFENLKREYESVLSDLKKLQDITPDQYEAQRSTSYTAASEDMGVFRNIFIASAILTSGNGSHTEAIVAWKKALDVNPQSPICHYSLGREYLEAAEQLTALPQEQRRYLHEAVRHLSSEVLKDSAQARYRLALAHVRLPECGMSQQEKYVQARQAMDILEHSHRSALGLGLVDSALALSYCLAGRHAPDAAIGQDYKLKAARSFARIKGLPQWQDFYNTYSDACMQE